MPPIEDAEGYRWMRQVHCSLRQACSGWTGVGMAMSIALVAAAFIVLCVMLRDVGIGGVMAAILAIPPRAVLTARGLVCIGYCTITLYDYFALRVVGRPDVPYATALLAGFIAYGIGHGLGLTLLTGQCGAAADLLPMGSWCRRGGCRRPTMQ